MLQLLTAKPVLYVCNVEEAKAAMYTLPTYDDYGYGTFGAGSGEAIRLDDAELGLDRF